MADVRAHIVDARDEEPDLPVEQVLDRLGSPEDFAEDAMERFGTARSRPVLVDYLAVGLLLIGGLILPVVGWFVGLALLLSSPSWTRADKALGALVVPGGLLPGLLLPVLAVGGVRACSGFTDASGRIVQTCAGEPSNLAQVWTWLLLAVLIIAPIATAVWLLRRLR